MHNFIRIPLTLTAISLLTACGSAIKLSDTPVESRVPVLVGAESSSASGSASRSGAAGAGAGPAGRSGGASGSGTGATGAGGASRAGGASGTGGTGGASGGSTAGGFAGAGGSGSAAGPGFGGAGTGGSAGAAAGSPGTAGTGSAWGTSGAGGVNPAGTALPSAVGASRLASISTITPPPIAPRDDSAAASPSMSRIGSANPPPMAPRDDPAVLPPGMSRIVYFDFDSFVVRNEARPVIEAHARVLTSDRVRRMVIEGHTDDRGGREYNLALGQKRAEAVLRALVMLGASDAQLEAVSFGKERPAMQGSDEAAWAQNRRAELKDRR